MRYQITDIILLAILACFFYLAQLVRIMIPAEPAPLPDVCGVYDGSRGEGMIYAVNVYADEDGTRHAQWRDDEDRVAWIGQWAEQPTAWRETYVPAGQQCSPWTWEVTGRDPLKLEGAGWKLSRKSR